MAAAPTSAPEQAAESVWFLRSRGETKRIPLPAPVQKLEQQPNEIPLFQSYDVSIHYPGYFRMESRSVPIFAGITSLQKFAMIPLPQFSDATTQTIIYENTEPKR